MRKGRLSETVVGFCLAVLWAGCLFSCGSPERAPDRAEMRAFEAFVRAKADSVSIAPRRVREYALQCMQEAKDSLARYSYLAVVLRTCLSTSDLDSARLLIGQIEAFAGRQPLTPRLADLRSECLNMKGNVYARMGDMDSAEVCFRRSYELRMQGKRKEAIPDILINLADASNRLGKLDVGAAWYRKALLLCDSLGMPSNEKTPIYYGLAQIYVALRDFEQCDYFYNLAALHYEEMLPFEKHFYLNNRGTSYYYREDYETAIDYFRKVTGLVEDYPDMVYELNLGWLNLGDCFLQLGQADSAARYISLCQPFFEKTGMAIALYYIDTQRIELALLRKELDEARRLLTESVTPPGIDPDMVHIRNRYLQQYCEETGNFRLAYHFMKENRRLDDSIRGERIRMRTADLALRYQQDSTLMAQKMLIQRQENEVLELRQKQAFWIVLSIITLLAICFVYVYNKKKQALLLSQSRRIVSSLRLENIRNRLSPHFIFNVLNRELSGWHTENKQGLSALVRLMRRNLELVEQLCITLDEELDFVGTYLELESRSLGEDFHPSIEVDKDVDRHLLLPSMMIQLPVENAVKHALREKEGERRLWITVRRQMHGVCIRITDNGGGFSPESRNRGTGTGIKAIMQTIQALNYKNKEKIDVSVRNVSLPAGAIGCEVMFYLPDGYDYVV